MNYLPDVRSKTMIAEVKSGLPGVRGLRTALFELVGSLVDAPNMQAVLLLVEPKVTTARITGEWERLRSALRPEIAENLGVAVFREGRFETQPASLPAADRAVLERLALDRAPTPHGHSLPRPDRQSEVSRVLILQWLQHVFYLYSIL